MAIKVLDEQFHKDIEIITFNTIKKVKPLIHYTDILEEFGIRRAL